MFDRLLAVCAPAPSMSTDVDINMRTAGSYESDVPLAECARCGHELEWPAVAPNPEDAEFMHMPRLLACLHTLCNSCVEDARARA